MEKEELCKKCIYYDRYEHKPCLKMAFRKGAKIPECFNFVDVAIFHFHKEQKDEDK